ncbi:MAG: hypothetical protein ACK5HU_05575 [Flavobacteriales bacterium]
MRTIFYLIFISLTYTSLVGQQNDSLMLLDPKYTFFKHNVVMFNEYLDEEGKGKNTTNLRYTSPVGKGNWNIRVDIPVVSSELSGKNGLGNLSASFTYIPFMTKNIGYWVRGRVFSPTASPSELGSGKWLFSPTVGFGKKFDKNLTYLASYEHRFSFAGSSNQNDYHTGIIDTSLIFGVEKYWFSFNPNIFVNYENNAQVSTFMAFEIGRRLVSEVDFYISPSFGIGDSKPHDFGLEFGLATKW